MSRFAASAHMESVLVPSSDKILYPWLNVLIACVFFLLIWSSQKKIVIGAVTAWKMTGTPSPHG